MKLVALISGGKDSCFSMYKCIEEGHEIVALANLVPISGEEEDSYMYQTVGSEAVGYYAQAMNLPLYRREIKGKPINQNGTYERIEGDEVEDLYELLKSIQSDNIDFEGISVGAIFSNYQSVRAQNVCDRLGIKMLAPIWHREQTELLKQMIDCKFKAILIKVAALGLNEQHLGKTIEEMLPALVDLNGKFGINVCGEGGEYETLVLDCPLFKQKLVM